VGSETATSPDMIRQISDRLSRLRIIYHVRGQTRTCSVDDLFKRYLSEVPVLPEDTRLWGFTLTNYFWMALTDEMQSKITDNKTYAQPDMSTLVTKTIQLNELRKLREATVQASKEIADHDTKLSRMISDSLKRHQPYQRPASPGPTAAVHAVMTSAAETVIT
jgi:transcription termination factor NusB